MKYYVRKETDHNGTFYCAYKNPNFTEFIKCKIDLIALQKDMSAMPPKNDVIVGEFDTDKPVEPDDEEDVCQDCGDPTDDADDEYCHPCKCARAEMAVESSMDR